MQPVFRRPGDGDAPPALRPTMSAALQRRTDAASNRGRGVEPDVCASKPPTITGITTEVRATAASTIFLPRDNSGTMRLLRISSTRFLTSAPATPETHASGDSKYDWHTLTIAS